MSLRDSVPGLADNHIPIEFANVAASSTHTNTTTAANFDVTYDIPPNRLKVGDVVRIKAYGIATGTNMTDTLTLRLLLDTTELLLTGAPDVADDDVFIIEFDLVIRTIGSSGTMVGFGKSFVGTLKQAPSATDIVNWDALPSTAVDTTQALTVAVEADWSAASASDVVQLEALIVQILQPNATA